MHDLFDGSDIGRMPWTVARSRPPMAKTIRTTYSRPSALRIERVVAGIEHEHPLSARLIARLSHTDAKYARKVLADMVSAGTAHVAGHQPGTRGGTPATLYAGGPAPKVPAAPAPKKIAKPAAPKPEPKPRRVDVEPAMPRYVAPCMALHALMGLGRIAAAVVLAIGLTGTPDAGATERKRVVIKAKKPDRAARYAREAKTEACRQTCAERCPR